MPTNEELESKFLEEEQKLLVGFGNVISTVRPTLRASVLSALANALVKTAIDFGVSKEELLQRVAEHLDVVLVRVCKVNPNETLH